MWYLAFGSLIGLVGLILPGYLCSRVLGVGQSIWTGLIISILILVNAVVGMQVTGIDIVPSRVGALWLAIAALSGAILFRRQRAVPVGAEQGQTDGTKINLNEGGAPDGDDRLKTIAILASLMIGAVVLLRAFLWPLSGYDVPFRWEFLALRLHEFKSIWFYPPVGAEAYRIYFYNDGMAPAVQFVYWWIYAFVGRAQEWTCWFILAQYAGIACFTYALSARLGSKRAGWFALAMVVSSEHINHCILIGQESGLLSLSLVATLYHAVAGCEDRRWQSFAVAGLCAGLGALSREYGCAWSLIGFAAVIWMNGGWRNAMVLLGTAALVALPWYARMIAISGNPFYGNAFLGLPVATMHARIMDYYTTRIGIQTWSLETWMEQIQFLLGGAMWQITLGFAAAIVFFRRYGFIGGAIVLVGLLWVYSVGRTHAGPPHSTRVLGPAFVVASALAGVFIDSLPRSSQWIRVWWVAFAVYFLVGLATTAIFPGGMPDLRNSTNIWFARRVLPPAWYDSLPGSLPPGSRVLSSDAYMHAGLYEKLEVVPVWSPEVEFLLDPKVTPLEARRRLQRAGINWVELGNGLASEYLMTHVPFFREDSQSWKLRITDDSSYGVYELPPPKPPNPSP